MIGPPLPRTPFRALVGNLAWTHDGTVWAVWRVERMPYRYASRDDKISYGHLTATLLRALRGEPLLLSVCGRLDPAGWVPGPGDPGVHPVQREITTAYRRQLAEYDLRERSYWLAVPLPHTSGWSGAGAVTAGASTLVARGFGLTPPLPGAAEVRRRAEQAARLSRGLTGLSPAGPEEILWLHRRAARRGTAAEPALSRAGANRLAGANPLAGADRLAGGARRAGGVVRSGRLRSPSFASLGEVHLDEGGRAGHRATSNPFHHRYLIVTTPDGGPSYQAFLVLADLPDSWRFPGGEWLAMLHEDTGFPIDWAVRATVTPGAEARSRVRRKWRQLSDQVGEYTPGDNESTDGVEALPAWVATGQRQLSAEQAALEAHSAEVEYEATVLLGVWGSTVDECEAKAETLCAAFSDELTAVRPTGDQLACYAAMVPGVASPRVVGDYRQYLLAGDLAKAMPFVGGHLGDQSGQVLGLGIDAGTVAPVRLHLPGWTARDISASLGLFAELGAGKSVTLKKLVADVAAAGGRTIGWDRTRTREQVAFLATVFGPAAVQVADLADPTGFSLDPLRILAGTPAAQAAETFLSQLLGVEATSERGTVLAETLDKLVAGEGPSMSRLTETLLAMRDDPTAHELGRRIRAAARRAGTSAIFDPALPPLDLSADHVVFATHGMTLPKSHELRSDRQLSQLPFPALFGRAVLTLSAVVAKTVAFADPGRFTLVHADECYWLTREGEGSPGYDTALELIRDGRKNNAGLILAGHDPADTGDETLLGLLSAVLVGRQRSRTLAERCVGALGVTDEALADRLVSVVTDDLSPLTHTDERTGDLVVAPGREGEFLARIHHRIGTVKVLVPPVPRIEAAIRTTPGGGKESR